MHDPRMLREERDAVRAGVVKKLGTVPPQLDRFYELDTERLTLLKEADALKHERNQSSEEIARLKKAGQDAAALITAMKAVSDRIQLHDRRLRAIEEELEEVAAWIPNLPHASVPEGRDAAANVEVAHWGEGRKFDFEPKPHWELAEQLGLIDFERGPKLAGSGFPLFVGDGARLVRALVDFMLDLHIDRHGYTEVHPAIAINSKSLRGTGQLPKLAEDMYRIQDEDLWLNPTAEVPVTNIYQDEILEPGVIPRTLTAYCPSFRKEAGAYGKDTRGIQRLHQFDKVELVRFVLPEKSYEEHETLRGHVEAVLRALELPYRVLLLCAGDLSFAASKCYDFETWAPGQKAWLEVSSCSNFEAFQARRAGIRFRREAGAKPEFAHTLNASGLALPRIVITILEAGQDADGRVRIPAAIRDRMGGREWLEPAR
ncbi:MAG: serine--tRNA ligase [Candidatus Eiseniibacteriota bacterium]